MARPLVLTIDIGSSSLRTNLFDEAARRLPSCEAQLRYETRSIQGGGVEIDPDDLSDRLFSAIDETLLKADRRGTAVSAVGFCSLVSNVLGIDAQGKPTTPIYTWADTRCAPQAEVLRHRLDEVEVHERTGCHIHTSYLPARLLWLQEEMPQAYSATACWISLGEYIYLLLFGRYGQSLSVASWSGLLNRHSLDWDDWLLAQIGLSRSSLPSLVDAYDGVRDLLPQFAGRWPSLKDALWLPCVSDGVTGNLGSGCYSPAEWAVQVGTSGALRALVSTEYRVPSTKSSVVVRNSVLGTRYSVLDVVPMGLWCYRLDRHSALLGGALSEGGNVIAWLRDTLQLADLDAAEREAASLPPDSHGLTILPFIAGERSPGWNSSARMHIAGISLSTRPVDILRAAQEAIAYRLAAIYDLMTAALPAPTSIIASGSALLNTPRWIQMLTDVLGSPVTASAEEEASSKGAALMALRALGHLSDYNQLPPSLGSTHHPDFARHIIYRKAMARQQALYKKTYQKTE